MYQSYQYKVWYRQSIESTSLRPLSPITRIGRIFAANEGAPCAECGRVGGSGELNFGGGCSYIGLMPYLAEGGVPVGKFRKGRGDNIGLTTTDARRADVREALFLLRRDGDIHRMHVATGSATVK